MLSILVVVFFIYSFLFFLFCKFFKNMTSNLKTKAIPLKNFLWEICKNHHTYSTFPLKEIYVNGIFKLLKKRSRRKAFGHDNFLCSMLINSAIHIAKPLVHITNAILKSNIDPDDFKHSVVTPF